MDLSEIYCARDYNKYGRYISLINIKGRRRAVIIIPEMTLNSGWSGIADKIERFISSHKHVGNRGVHRLVDKNIPYAKILKSIKWANKGNIGSREEGILKRGDRICINDNANSYNEVLKKSLVGKFVYSKGEAPTLADIKRWTNDLWKQTYGLNIYEMGNDYFLFEFSSMITAEQVVEGNWSWRNSPVLFQWWNPTICTSLETERARTTWIKIVGMPLQFWSHGVFKAIGDFCGGWVKTEEETQLRNHLKWARIKVEGDGTKVPKEVTIDDGNLQFMMQIWTESPARVFAGEEQSQKIPSKVNITQRSKIFVPKNRELHRTLDSDMSATAGQPRANTETRKEGSKFKLMGQDRLVGYDPTINLGLNCKGGPFIIPQTKEKACESHVTFNERAKEGLTNLKTLATQFLKAFSSWESSSVVNLVEQTPISKQREAYDIQQGVMAQNRLDKNLGKQLQEVGEGSKPPENFKAGHSMQIQQIHDVEPVSTNMPEIRQDQEGEASQWINAHIMELSAAYGVAFEGFREETHALLMRLDERKAALENKNSDSSNATPRNRGIGKNELKNLQSCLNQEVEGSRTKGRVLSLIFK
ncbi:hypothetical protein KY290_010248 [Solanum tuberosum]|uniref:DUF4283 domain-containing protein n=1 Tax=Solanum tuberosum TaxID=4113 RepID=A0ABQ7VX89_SOLTU|nr:hypothetical protein KY289_010633 [Solanum tuberosum]KAH0773111.1 hypothetical protein KY290_010248 [Solanum tuberosum]